MKLWSVEEGSFIWGMNHPGSDHDLFNAYVVSSHDLLAGRVAPGGCHVGHHDAVPWDDKHPMDAQTFTPDGAAVDYQTHELSRWIDGALKGNFNYVIGIFSPIVYYDNGNWLRDLREILRASRSRALVPHTLGLARSGICKAERHRDTEDIRRAWKNLRTSMRAIRFTRHMLITGEPLFAPVTDMPKELGVSEGIKHVENAMLDLEELDDRLSTVLPKSPDDEPFRQFTYRLRHGVLLMEEATE